jgi:hypothetical protein
MFLFVHLNDIKTNNLSTGSSVMVQHVLQTRNLTICLWSFLRKQNKRYFIYCMSFFIHLKNIKTNNLSTGSSVMVRHVSQIGTWQFASGRFSNRSLHLFCLLHHWVFLPTEGTSFGFSCIVGDARSNDATNALHSRRF